MTTSTEDYFMNGASLKQYLGISESFYRKLIESKLIPHRKVGRVYRFKKSEIDTWIDSNPNLKEN